MKVAVQLLHDCHLQWNSCSKNVILNSCTLSIFPALEIRKLVLVGKLLRRSDWLLIQLIYLFFISILYEMIKILHEKMLNAIFNDWFHDDTWSLQWALNKWIEVCHISCQVKPSWWYVIELFLAILKKTFTSKNVGPKGNPVTTPSIWM